MQQHKINIAKDFSPTPGPRYIKEGDNSGELFRQKILYPKIKEVLEKSDKLLVDLDGTAGYGTSFLEESFGGLIRVEGIVYENIKNVLSLKSSEEPFLIEDVWSYLKDAANEENKSEKK